MAIATVPTRPTVTVVLCTYNGKPYLRPQLASLSGQSVRIDELIVSDDASSDGTAALLKSEIPNVANRTDLVCRHVNVGAVTNFDQALHRPTGDLVLLCDQDDVWHRTKVARLLDTFQSAPEALMVASDARIVDSEGRPRGLLLSTALGLESAGSWSRSDWMVALMRRNRVTGATCGVRRELLDIALPIPRGFWHDEWLALVAAACDGLLWLNEVLTDYRIHGRNAAGLRGAGLLAVLEGAASGGRSHHSAKAQKLRQLAERLRLRAGAASADRLREVDAAVSFWASRADLRGPPWRRARFVAETLASRRYRTFGDGLRSAVRDLLF